MTTIKLIKLIVSVITQQLLSTSGHPSPLSSFTSSPSFSTSTTSSSLSSSPVYNMLTSSPSPLSSTSSSSASFLTSTTSISLLTKQILSSSCFFQPDGQYHSIGSTWHPFIPSFGIDKCTLCTCQNITLKVTCRRHFSCPPLACDPATAIRENPLDCCKKCPDSIQVKSLDGEFGLDEQVTSLKSNDEQTSTVGACVLLGRLYPNGHKWHPQVTPFGEIRCVKCLCKNGSVKCSRIKCSRSNCLNKSSLTRKCCPKCSTNQYN